MHFSFLTNKKKTIHTKGFTLIEVMVSTAIFVVIMVMGIGAVLNANASHKETQGLRTIIDNLNFVMEDMARNLRLGTSYHCPFDPNSAQSLALETAQDCNYDSLSIAFEKQDGLSGNGADQSIYRINTINGPSTAFVEKSTDGGLSFYPITPEVSGASVKIDALRSGFFVIGTVTAQNRQPLVIIRLAGTISVRNVDTPFNLQTTVSERAIETAAP